MTTIDALISLATDAIRVATHRLDAELSQLDGQQLDRAIDHIDDLTEQLQQLCQRLVVHHLTIEHLPEAAER